MNDETSDKVQKASVEPIVYVVDDDPSMRDAVATLVRSVGFNVQSFSSADDFLMVGMPDVPACLVIDARLNGESGLAVQERCSAQQIRIPIIFMTGHGDIAMSVAAMKAGAFDLLTKPFREQDMLDAVAGALERDRQRRAADRPREYLRQCYATLTPREREVMRLIAKGLRNKQIAAELCRSEITVKIHRNRAMKKMQARSLADFVLKAGVLGVETGLPFPLQQRLTLK
jgi:RNA polymerase sigma factor (sigma-70 family)